MSRSAKLDCSPYAIVIASVARRSRVTRTRLGRVALDRFAKRLAMTAYDKGAEASGQRHVARSRTCSPLGVADESLTVVFAQAESGPASSNATQPVHPV